MKRYFATLVLVGLILKVFGQSCTLSVAITSSSPAICSDNVVTLTATASAGKPAYRYVWNTGETTTSININKGGTYSVTVTDGTPGCQPVVQQISISAANTPVAPSVNDAVTCPGVPVTLTATAPGGFYQWYDAPVGGNLVATGPNFSPPASNGSATYYVETTIAQCTSLRHTVKVYVVSNLTVADVIVCGNNRATFSARGAINYKWYDAPGGNLLGTDSLFTTPVLSQTTTYYVVGTGNGCTSNVTPVTATVMVPPVAPTASNVTVCYGTAASLSATPVNGAVLQWFDVPSGGSAIITSPDYTTPPLLASRTYYVQAFSNQCPSARIPVVVTVNPIPQPPVVPGAEICQGTSTTLNITSPNGSTYQWFDSANGQNVMATGNSFSTPVLINSATYYVQSTNGGCISGRTAVTVTVDQPLVPPSALGKTVCFGNTATLSASALKGTLQWYDAATGGNLISSNKSFTTQPLTADTNFYVQAVSALGCISIRTKVHVSVMPIPVAPTATGQTICNGTSATLIAAGSFTNYEWYDAPTGGNLLTTSQAYVTPILTANATYYLQTQQNGCVSPRSAVTVAVNPALTKPTATGVTICENTAATLTATVASGSIQWFDAPAGGTLLQTGNTFNTPVLSKTTTYYAQSTDGQCNSQSTAVIVTITPVPNPGFLYSSGVYCLSGVNPSPIIGNPAGGTFTATPAGMVFANANTGEINLAACDTGTYNVTFTSNGCVNVASTKIKLVITPDATFSYNGPYCQDGSDPLPTFPKGAGGGNFSATPAGLVINHITIGDINLAGSKPGTYTVTNTIPASGGCPEVTFSQQVVIEQAAQVNAGPNQTVGTGSPVQLAGAFSGATTAVVWSGGAGSFSNTSNPKAIYTPAAGETSADLTLTTNDPVGLCGPKSSTVHITFGVAPVAPTIANATTCPGSSATLIATAPGGSYAWYDAPTGGNLVDTSAVFNTPPLNVNTSYYVDATTNGITGPRKKVTVTINSLTPPVAPTVIVCSGTAGTLTASGSAGTYAWYDAATGGNLLSTNSSFVTPAVIADTAYFVESVINGCISPRTLVKVKVSKLPVITSASSVEACSGTALNYVITSDSTATYSWSRAAVADISNPAVSNVTSATIGETLINTSNVPVNVTYVITPAGKCTGAPFYLVVAVNPVAFVTSAPALTICNNTSSDYAVQFGTTPDSFTWSRAAVVGITNPPIADQTASTIREVLTNVANFPVVVHYLFNSNTKSCPSSVFDFAVTVNPTAHITSDFLTAICSGTAPNYKITANINPVTFSWSREAIPGISNPAVYNQTSDVINETLVDTTRFGIYVPYTIIPIYNGCPGTPFIYKVGVTAPLPPPVVKTNSPVCLNSTIRLSTDYVAGATYQWTGPNGFTSTQQNPTVTNVTKANAGDYHLVITVYCPSDVSTVNVAVDDFPHADAGPNQVVCKNTTAIKLDGKITGGTTTGIWSTAGTGTFSPANNVLDATYIPSDQDAASGTVALTLTSTSKDDCKIDMATTSVTFMPLPTAYAGLSTDECSQVSAIPLNGISTFADTFLWTTSGSGTFGPSATVANPIYIPSSADIRSGTVTLTFSAKNSSCAAAISDITFKFIPPPTVSMPKLRYIFRSDKVVLVPQVNGEGTMHYLWTPNLYISSDTVKTPTFVGVDDVTYTLKVTDARGCVTEETFTIKIIDRLNIPNTFTPNGDGINDLWDIPGLIKYPGAVVDIFTRYGGNIFHSVGYGIPWDGTYNGKRLPTGVYYYTIKTQINDQIVSGPVTIIR